MQPEKKLFSCIIADDDEIDRLTTLSFCRQYPFLQITGSFASSAAALDFARQYPPDVMLLDIDMPGLDGRELRKRLEGVPVCIFITSHYEHAVESFELSVLDFLVKPLRSGRFAAAMERVDNYLNIRHKAALLDNTLGGDILYIKDGHEHIKIKMHDIIYLEALKDYTGIVTRQKKYCVLTPFSSLLKEQNFCSFIRIHRSYAVQRHYIDKITSREVMLGNIGLPVGRMYKDSLEFLKK